MTAMLETAPYHGSYINDYVRKCDHGHARSGDVRQICALPVEVVQAMVQLAYPGTTIENYTNKCFTIVGLTRWAESYVCVYRHDDHWYMYFLVCGAFDAKCRDSMYASRVKAELSESLPWY
jgi:hypothetical protein